ncbi:uncharacterized protein BXZ73DRAFT_12159, partial [Epithele typhae]|uniref:uncharacterized protein n=1 Tax=Epithele typhae TaxID=378194 RepID=UPI00200885A7
IEDRRRVLAAEERQLHSSWNATLPIHHLPRELLVDIFATALRSSWTSLGESETETTTAATGGKRAVLMLVCSAWRELIASEGTLWSLMYVTPSTPLAILSLHKLRSAKAALEVRLDMKPDNSLEAARILAPESERIRSLSIPSARDLPLPTFHALFCDKSWPLLTHLDIKFSFRSSEQHITQIDLEPILKLSALRFPNLQSLALSSGPIPAIDVQLLRQLKSLKVYSHCPVEWPSFQQFLTDLSQAVQLEALTI